MRSGGRDEQGRALESGSVSDGRFGHGRAQVERTETGSVRDDGLALAGVCRRPVGGARSLRVDARVPFWWSHRAAGMGTVAWFPWSRRSHRPACCGTALALAAGTRRRTSASVCAMRSIVWPKQTTVDEMVCMVDIGVCALPTSQVAYQPARLPALQSATVAIARCCRPPLVLPLPSTGLFRGPFSTRGSGHVDG